LRAALNDPLFVRVRVSMEPTPKARAIAEEVDPLLGLRQRLVEGGLAFNPATLQREFVIAGSDVGQFIATSKIYNRHQQDAPTVRFRGVTLNANEMFDSLENGDIDLVFGPYPRLVALTGHHQITIGVSNRQTSTNQRHT